MDTAEEDEMRRALMQQGVLLGHHQEEITASRSAYSEISLQLNRLVERFDQLHPSPSVATPPPDQDGTINRHAETTAQSSCPLLRWAQHLSLFFVAMLSNLLAAAVLFSHGAL